ncbi:sensor histidine kinase [Alteromonas lipolytica]|uniref:Signal transduction histidine kinase subgroup 3 dimerisation and phosphoacceptor domain-containing protein n=1 Tax=Alteromonas lipolytica TaxID=1856405 RepID=A0A1E8FBS3_9ALTE|nr:sensor histidine kinase [Alteromonas lipolytica]OFI33365.1 hypothetical protein BFC17_03635 [Alteromonas lipolytica]GGF60366.1 histidine kinase [Alteromonas lipolytica]
MTNKTNSLATSIHRRLLPPALELGGMPYLWLVYLGFFAIHYFLYDPPVWHIGLGILGTVAFLVCYFRAYWTTGAATLIYIIAICAIGTGLSWVNPGAGVFFIYASAFASLVGPPRYSIAIVASILLYIVALSWLRDLSAYFYAPALIFSLIIGTANIFQREIDKKNAALKLSQEEVKRLATVAERERIARDLHDLIGHSFAMLTMKAQLAQKLFDHDTDKARQEIAELEQISRSALADVREAVTGYRQKDLNAELANAKTLLNSVDVAFSYTIPDTRLPNTVDITFGFIVREAVTNLMKHSDANSCQIELTAAKNKLMLTIADNGNATHAPEGNGLKGMRERISQLNGEIRFNHNHGFSIMAEVPL